MFNKDGNEGGRETFGNFDVLLREFETTIVS